MNYTNFTLESVLSNLDVSDVTSESNIECDDSFSELLNDINDDILASESQTSAISLALRITNCGPTMEDLNNNPSLVGTLSTVWTSIRKFFLTLWEAINAFIGRIIMFIRKENMRAQQNIYHTYGRKNILNLINGTSINADEMKITSYPYTTSTAKYLSLLLEIGSRFEAKTSVNETNIVEISDELIKEFAITVTGESHVNRIGVNRIFEERIYTSIFGSNLPQKTLQSTREVATRIGISGFDVIYNYGKWDNFADNLKKLSSIFRLINVYIDGVKDIIKDPETDHSATIIEKMRDVITKVQLARVVSQRTFIWLWKIYSDTKNIMSSVNALNGGKQ